MTRRLCVDSFLMSSCPASRTVAIRLRTSADKGELGGDKLGSDEMMRTGRSPNGQVPRVSRPEGSLAAASAKMASNCDGIQLSAQSQVALCSKPGATWEHSPLRRGIPKSVSHFNRAIRLSASSRRARSSCARIVPYDPEDEFTSDKRDAPRHEGFE